MGSSGVVRRQVRDLAESIVSQAEMRRARALVCPEISDEEGQEGGRRTGGQLEGSQWRT